MKEKHINVTILNIIFYVLGFVLVGLGVNLMESSDLGMGAWDTVTFNIYHFTRNILDWQFVKVGYVSMTISLTIFIAVLLYRKKISLLFMLVPVLFVGTFINIWYYQVFETFETTSTVVKVLLYASGLLTIPFGLALVVKSTFPAFVFDEWTFMMADVLETKNFAKVRIGIEVTGITIGAIFGFLTFWAIDGNLGAVNLGSLIAAVLFGPILAQYLKLLPTPKSNTFFLTRILWSK